MKSPSDTSDSQPPGRNEDVALAYALLHSSIESLKDILIFSIDRNYLYLNFNGAFKDATFYVYGTRVTIGASMLDTILDEKERDKAKANCDRALLGESHQTVEVYGTLNPTYFETRYSPILAPDESIIGVTILSTNITERKLAEEQIIALNKELEAFSYSVAHDLRAPLRVISGYSGILMEEQLENLNEECQKLLTKISGNVGKMTQLIDDLLNFSKLGRTPVTKVNVDITTLVKSILEEQVVNGNKERIDIRLGVLENLNCDKNLMRQAFSNLISNAIKYSGKQEKSIIEIDSVKQGEEVTYSIKDNGAGFDMKYADKIFGVFQRLHGPADFEGTGVGLAIVQRIIAKHGGRIWAEAEVGVGATFHLKMPC